MIGHTTHIFGIQYLSDFQAIGFNLEYFLVTMEIMDLISIVWLQGGYIKNIHPCYSIQETPNNNNGMGNMYVITKPQGYRPYPVATENLVAVQPLITNDNIVYCKCGKWQDGLLL